MDNINNTIYTTLAQHTSIHTSAFYLITVVNSDANVKLRPEGGAHHDTELSTVLPHINYRRSGLMKL